MIIASSQIRHCSSAPALGMQPGGQSGRTMCVQVRSPRTAIVGNAAVGGSPRLRDGGAPAGSHGMSVRAGVLNRGVSPTPPTPGSMAALPEIAEEEDNMEEGALQPLYYHIGTEEGSAGSLCRVSGGSLGATAVPIRPGEIPAAQRPMGYPTADHGPPGVAGAHPYVGITSSGKIMLTSSSQGLLLPSARSQVLPSALGGRLH